MTRFCCLYIQKICASVSVCAWWAVSWRFLGEPFSTAHVLPFHSRPFALLLALLFDLLI